MGRIRRGWELTKRSWALLREHRSLIRFPIYGALATLALLVLTVLPGLYLIDTKETAPGVVLVAIGLYLVAFTGFYFSVGLAATADQIFQGRDATISDGFAVARTRLGAIAGWALLSTIVGLVLNALESQRGLGQIAGALLGVAWSLITFLAVPVIAFEGTGPVATFKRSAQLFRERWAGQVTGNVAIGGIVLLLGVLPAIALVVLGIVIWSGSGNGADVAAGGVLVAIGLVVFAIATLITRALRGIFGVALYRYALDGQPLGGFSSEELESAVRTRGSRGLA